jgi:hypothetical protein
MPLRLDNAKGVAHMPTAGTTAATIDDEAFKPRFKVDLAASPMPETRQPERLAPRATSNRNGGRDHLGILGEIKSVHPGEIIGISKVHREDNFGRPRSCLAAHKLSGLRERKRTDIQIFNVSIKDTGFPSTSRLAKY